MTNSPNTVFSELKYNFMKIGVISDIHGNCDALAEVLKKAKEENEQIVN